jgi:hypothetical protein
MKKGLLIVTVGLAAYSAFGQGTLIFNNGTGVDVGPVFTLPGSNGGPASYATGTLVSNPPGVTGSAADVRAQSFSGSGYFTGSEGADTAFGLRLGNGVSPLAVSGNQVSAAPEPSSIALAILGAAALFGRTLFGKRVTRQ